MTREPLIRFFQSTGLISAAQAAEIAAGFTRRTLARHELLLPAGQVSDEYLFLDQGLLRAFALDEDGNDVTTGFFSVGQVALEVASFFNRTPSQETLQALTDSAGWGISYAQLNGLFHARPEFREFGRSVLVRELTRLKTRLLALTTTSAAARYEALLHSSPEILQQVPLKHIASYLGVTDSSLSRIRAGSRGPEPA
ncbi:Crp/Fnr family transcriptional regulator [Hymenobacter sp. BT635]|uniref:Crp/Fnr family transcriptional regulator n=1 Tax=Hymenobacter nitidus TaxID=2880929 RepID=A0ABS8AB39_9BACT|nr:Crp/Fnr family transcriptional regulator [Hymenobacter nitidus]MCB2376254.1 Crp/Fnr family transcriptional regulator [Hymenobacter nitidus]